MSRKSATTNPPDKTAQPVRVYRLKISLKNTDPVIWRRLEVPGDLPMNYLAGTIETVFGWSGSHCAEFVIKERRIGDGTDWRHVDATANVAEIESLLKSLQRGQTGKKGKPMSGDALVALLTEKLNAAMGSPPEDDDVIATLEELIPRVRTKFRFIYDFGDHWDHQIEVEAIHPPASDLKSQRPRCVDGARGKPLEDCGGPWRFAGLLEAREDRNHPSREQLEEFDLQRWDPAKFSVASADKKLAGMFGRQPFRKESES